jgi:hypothetical protein
LGRRARKNKNDIIKTLFHSKKAESQKRFPLKIKQIFQTDKFLRIDFLVRDRRKNRQTKRRRNKKEVKVPRRWLFVCF